MRATALVFVAGLLGCAEPPERTPVERQPPDKAALFGDPSLVPTREGERARSELAAAGELVRTIAALDAISDVEVNVELEDDGPRTLVVARLVPRADEPRARAHVEQIVAGVLGNEALTGLQVLLESSDEPEAPADADVPLALAFAILGLGASLGVTIDRALARLLPRRQARRARKR